jgi:hypothetical protein
MIVRVAYLKRDASGKVVGDGCCLHASWPVDQLPRVGEAVLLPQKMLDTVRAEYPELAIVRRFSVVSIDHHWDTMNHAVCLYVSTLGPPMSPYS